MCKDAKRRIYCTAGLYIIQLLTLLKLTVRGDKNLSAALLLLFFSPSYLPTSLLYLLIHTPIRQQLLNMLNR